MICMICLFVFYSTPLFQHWLGHLTAVIPPTTVPVYTFTPQSFSSQRGLNLWPSDCASDALLNELKWAARFAAPTIILSHGK